jgi:tight adherence protein C
MCLMPAVFLFLMGPAIIQLSDFFDAGGRDLFDNGAAQIEDYQPVE